MHSLDTMAMTPESKLKCSELFRIVVSLISLTISYDYLLRITYGFPEAHITTLIKI
jgi:hypothetical protein